MFRFALIRTLTALALTLGAFVVLTPSAEAATISAKARTIDAAVIAKVKHYVGYRYVEGGATPRRGFDCSGLVKYVYEHVSSIRMEHFAQSQYRQAHRISRARAIPGDIVFFHDGSGYTYHVGIYAGHNKMYAAATPRDGVRYQYIWSSAVTFGSFTHR